MTNPLTTAGDIIYSSSGTTPARLGIGSTGTVLSPSGGIPAWVTLGDTWTSYTPTVTPSSGSATTSSLGAAYVQYGKTMKLRML